MLSELSNACKGDLFTYTRLHARNAYARSGPQKPTRCIYIACSEGGVLNAFAARLEVEQFRQAVVHLKRIASQSSVHVLVGSSSL